MKIIFYILVLLMLAWSVFVWQDFELTVLDLLFSLSMWCLVVVPLGVIALLVKPR